jgi:hypothetical protein
VRLQFGNCSLRRKLLDVGATFDCGAALSLVVGYPVEVARHVHLQHGQLQRATKDTGHTRRRSSRVPFATSALKWTTHLKWQSKRKFEGNLTGERSLPGHEEPFDRAKQIVDNLATSVNKRAMEDVVQLSHFSHAGYGE